MGKGKSKCRGAKKAGRFMEKRHIGIPELAEDSSTLVMEMKALGASSIRQWRRLLTTAELK